MEYLKVGALSVRYSDVGSGEPALLIHGLGGSIESWTNNAGGLAKSLRVIMVDLPGFGLSDKPKMSYTIKFYRDFVIQFLKLLQLEQVSIVGSSLGGHVAAEVAISRPDLVRMLVMISPPGALPRSFKGTPALMRYAKVINAKSAQQIKQALFAVDSKPVDDSYAQLVYQKMTMPGAREAFLSALMGSAKAPRLNSRLHKIKAPTLLLWGKEDIMIPVRFAESFVKMKNCRIVLLERCGHRPHVDRPALFNKLVADFLTELAF
ncbi:MAG TPA: alpha/beta fold hydrolase [Nitrososphaera sp.]|nr:alpha/beta fold hydrolase [Nitrososphaera sp.]